MRFCFLLLLPCLLLRSYANGQIDTLRHRRSIEAFVAKSAHLRKVELLAINDVIGDSVLRESSTPAFWYHADFNHDGAADLLVRVRSAHTAKRLEQDELLVVTGGFKHTAVRLDNGLYKNNMNEASRVASPLVIGGKHYLVYTVLETRFTITSPRPIYRSTHDTIFVFQDRPMLFTTHPEPPVPLKQLSYTTTQCFGTCPVFQVHIFPNQTARYHGIYYTERPGHYQLRLKQRDYAYLTMLLSQLRLPQLARQYAVDWTDSQTCYLRVELATGQVSSIEDYGMQGTYGLAMLYQFLWQQYQPRSLYW